METAIAVLLVAPAVPGGQNGYGVVGRVGQVHLRRLPDCDAVKLVEWMDSAVSALDQMGRMGIPSQQVLVDAGQSLLDEVREAVARSLQPS
jgi:hypothetical protein